MKNDEAGNVAISNSSQITEIEGTNFASYWADGSDGIQEKFIGRRYTMLHVLSECSSSTLWEELSEFFSVTIAQDDCGQFYDKSQ